MENALADAGLFSVILLKGAGFIFFFQTGATMPGMRIDNGGMNRSGMAIVSGEGIALSCRVGVAPDRNGLAQDRADRLTVCL